MQILFSITNADYRNVSTIEKLAKSPLPVYSRNLLALIQVNIIIIIIVLQHGGIEELGVKIQYKNIMFVTTS